MMDWLSHLVAPLNQVLFNLGADAVSWAELLGFITGAAGVWLTVKSRISNFPVGIANSAFFLVLFASARLWADSGLQVMYIVLGFVGWWQWLRGGQNRTRLIVGRTTPITIAVLVLMVAGGTWGLTIGLGAAHDVAPFWDALTTMLSIAAQWLLNTKKIENWAWWMAADCIYIPLYFVKRLDLTGIVYVMFLAMCIAGVRAWIAAYRQQTGTAPEAVAAVVVA
jgi:nicotinamide mononucleotide transporter